MRRKLAAVGASYLIGLIFASIFVNFAIFLICGVILLVISAVAVALFLKKYYITAILLCCAMGIAVYFAVSSQLDKAAESLLDGTYDISATVTSKRIISTDSAVFTLESNTENGKVGILLYTDDISAGKGDTLRFRAEFSKLYNTAAYNTADRYRSDGITLSATLKSDITVTKGSYPLSFIDDYRNYLTDRIKADFSDDSGALMLGIFAGDKSSLSDELYYDIKAAGAAHLTAVSGMHLTLIITILMTLLSVTGIAGTYRIRFVLTVALTLCFTAFFGFTASVVRSGIMIITANIGAVFYRKSDCVTSVGLAVLLITLFDPLSCTDAGLILSAVTTLGAGAAAPAISGKLTTAFPWLNKKLCDTLCVSFCAALAGIPLSAIYFGTFSVAGIFVSVIVLPLFTVCLTAMLIYALTGGIITPIAVIAHFCCDIMRAVFSFFAAIPFLHFSCDALTVAITLIVALTIAVSAVILTRRKHITIIFLTAALFFTAVNAALPLLPSGNVEILLHSDGKNGSVVIISDDITAAVLIGNDKNELGIIRNEILDNNKTASCLTILCLDDHDADIVDTASRFSSAVSFCKDNNGISSRYFSLDCKNNSVLLTAFDTRINISDVGNIKENTANILWGTSGYISSSAPCFFINRYAKSKNGISLYYTDCKITVTADGMTVSTDNR
ncbi:MAG: ComEC/Rec2 family competence protein [Ruminiclostridium sp.]|nr:ComEC/Rec2 family competence protein [Ruminiclostridium sp.]